MAACNATDFIALVVQHEMLEGLDVVVACIYIRALASIPTGAPILQSPICPFFFISLYKKSLRPLGGLRKRHLSNVFSLLIQMTLCSVLLYHSIVNVCKVWVMFAWISLETKWCWLDLGKLSKRVKIISVLQTGSVWSLPYPAILQIIWDTKTSFLTAAETSIPLHLPLGPYLRSNI